MGCEGESELGVRVSGVAVCLAVKVTLTTVSPRSLFRGHSLHDSVGPPLPPQDRWAAAGEVRGGTKRWRSDLTYGNYGCLSYSSYIVTIHRPSPLSYHLFSN